MTKAADVTVLEFTGRFDDGTVYFQLYRFAMLYSEKYGYDSVQVGEEPFCYAADELTREGSTYTYPPDDCAARLCVYGWPRAVLRVF